MPEVSSSSLESGGLADNNIQKAPRTPESPNAWASQQLMDETTPVRKNPPRSPVRPSPQLDGRPAMNNSAASPSRSGRASGGSSAGDHGGAPPRPHHRQFASASSTTSKNSQDAAAHKQKQEHDDHQHDYHHSQSLPDRIGAAALGGTLDLLKFTTGVALSTTGALVAPPLHVTRTLILPQLLAALRAQLTDWTPRRLQDWLRIVASSVHHVVTLLQSTRRGIELRHSVVSVMVDVLDIMTSESFRQVIVDGMACTVKCAEAWSTEPARAATQQCAVTLTRIVQLLATQPSRQLTQDVARMVSGLAVLISDPTTIVALAQVTADLCYALEAEEAQLYNEPGDIVPDANGQDRDATKDASSGHRKFQQQRRQDRNKVEALLSSTKILARDPDATMEQVILSSLGETVDSICIEDSPSHVHDGDEDDSESLPSMIMAAALMDAEHDNHELHDSWQDMPHNDHDNLPPPPSRADTRVDTVYLHEKIHQRSRRVRKPSTTALDPSLTDSATKQQRPRVETVVDDGIDNISVEMEELGMDDLNPRPPKINLFAEVDDNEPDASAMKPLDDTDPGLPSAAQTDRLPGEAPADHFYRVLDDTLMGMRRETLKRVVLEDVGDALPRKGRVVRKTAGEEPENFTKESMKRILNNLRDEIGAERQKRAKPSALGRSLNYAVLAGVLTLVLSWTGLGCYGLYVAFHPPAVGSAREILPQSSSGKPSSQEVVIRVVKEVVHVDSSGYVIGKGDDTKILSSDSIDALAQCVIGSMAT